MRHTPRTMAVRESVRANIGNRQANVTEAWMLREYEKLERENIALVEALEAIIAASDAFERMTGMKHGDPLTDAVDKSRAALLLAKAGRV